MTATMEYDDLLQLVGEFGPLQKLTFLYGAFISLVSAANILDIVFVLGVPKHHCAVSENLTNPSILRYVDYNSGVPQLPLPLEENEGTTRYSQCEMYSRNFTSPPLDGDVYNSSWSSVESCDKWVYDDSTFYSTLVTKLDLVCDNKWLVSTAYTISMSGLLFGVFILGNLSDRIGRRKTIMLTVIGISVCKLVTTFVENYLVYVAAKFVVTACNIGSYTVGFVLCVELAGPTHRVKASMIFMYIYTLGYVLLAGAAYLLRDGLYIQLAFVIPYITLAGISWFLPESIRWLYSKGRVEEAEKMVCKIAKRNGTFSKLPKEFNVKIESNVKANVIDLFKTPRLRKRTLCLIYIWFTMSAGYYGLSLNSGSIGGDIYLNFFISGLVELPAYVGSHLALKYLGRKFPFFISLLAAGVLLLCCSLVPNDQTYVLLALSMAGKLCLTLAFALSYLYTSELNPTVLRSAAMATASAAARAGGICAPLIGNQLAEIKRYIPMVIFGVFAVVASLLALMLPETKDRPLPNSIKEVEDMHQEQKCNWSAVFRKKAKLTNGNCVPEEKKFIETTQEANQPV